MNPYCQYNDAFSNTDNDELDKMARKINNDRKKLRKQVQNNIINKENELCVGIDCLMDPSNSRISPTALLPNFSFFSTQGDFSSPFPTPLMKNKKNIKSSDQTFSDSSSLGMKSQFSDLDSIYSFNSLSSNYSSLNPKIKKHLRLSTNHLKSYEEKDDSAIMKHINKCEQCKDQLIKLLQNEKHVFETNKSEKVEKKEEVQIEKFPQSGEGGILNLNTSELKDVLILILAGIFIIIILDFFLRK